MTAYERRVLLEYHGFAVSRSPFPGSDGASLHYMLELRLDGTRDNRNNSVLQGRQYSINLESGIWNRWGTTERRVFDVGPWNELFDPSAESRVERQEESDLSSHPDKTLIESTNPSPSTSSDPWRSHEFIVRCLAAGFVIDEETESRMDYSKVDFGHRFALLEGTRYLLFTQTCKVVDSKFCKHELSEFVDGPGTRDEGLGKESPAPPVFMENRQSEYVGNTKQAELF